MKEGLLLTLKDLIKLGVINLKKKGKKKRRVQANDSLRQEATFQKVRRKEDPFSKGNNFNPMSMGQQRYKEFVNASQPPTQQQYTDNLRLRDANDNFNTRLREYKDTLENQKLLLNNQQEEQNKLSRFVNTGLEYISQDINRLNYDKGYVVGYVDDDNIDTATTFGSSEFKPQTSAKSPPQEELYTPFKDAGKEEIQFADNNDEPIGKPFEALAQSSEGEDEESSPQFIPMFVRPITTKKKQQQMTTYFNKPNDDYTETIEQPKAPIKAKKQSSLDEDYEAFVKDDESRNRKEGISGFPLPNIPVTKSEYFSPSKIPNTKKGKPSNKEIEQWKEWYLMLKLNDDDVLSSNKRSDYVQPILAKLKEQYTDLRGNDESVLKSKDPIIVYKAIRAKNGLK